MVYQPSDFTTEKPLVVVSACLEFRPCRFNAGLIRSELVRRLEPLVNLIAVCPETAIGLDVPRRPCRLIQNDPAPRLVQLGNRDCTEEITAFTNQFFQDLPPVDAFMLAGGSPSCALRDARVYPDETADKAVLRTAGAFGGRARRRFPLTPAEDSGRLRNYRLRDSFLTALFVGARLRVALGHGSLGMWQKFHDDNRLLIRAHNERAFWELSRLVAVGGHRAAAAYEQRLRAALARRPTLSDHRAVLVHAVREWLPPLTEAEKAFFEGMMGDYENRRIPLSTPRMVVREWAVRFERPSLLRQSYFTPYPEELLFLSDSGQGRDL